MKKCELGNDEYRPFDRGDLHRTAQAFGNMVKLNLIDEAAAKKQLRRLERMIRRGNKV